MKKRCSTNYAELTKPAPAPNPSPTRWKLLEIKEYAGGHVLRVHYLDCTNFEGVKVMVYAGPYSPRCSLDPHFQEGPEGPIARFRPDEQGWQMACDLAKSINLHGKYDPRP